MVEVASDEALEDKHRILSQLGGQLLSRDVAATADWGGPVQLSAGRERSRIAATGQSVGLKRRAAYRARRVAEAFQFLCNALGRSVILPP
jgi:hypothetical protein